MVVSWWVVSVRLDSLRVPRGGVPSVDKFTVCSTYNVTVFDDLAWGAVFL